ncbi:MAG: YitT family protein [Ignavibacteria bacterium]|nr:YitT family protein [Ignavibacteria bacterium]
MKTKSKKFWSGLRDFTGITIGCIIFGISYSWFLIPFKVAPGGIGGLAGVLYHLFGFPAGTSMIVINIPLFVVAWIFLGKQFGLRSFFGMLVGGFFVDLLSPHFLYENTNFLKHMINTQYWALTDNILLASIAGSVLLGFGLGIIFRFRGSTGGTDIPVAILKQYTGISIGTGYWVIESLIIFFIGIVFNDLNLIIWGYLNLFITTQIVDLTAEGVPYVKGAYIVSKNENKIRNRIIDELDRGITVLHSEGGYTGKPQNVLFCVVSRRQVALLRKIVKEEDKSAFMVLTDVNDVMGDGFKTRMLDLQEVK